MKRLFDAFDDEARNSIDELAQGEIVQKKTNQDAQDDIVAHLATAKGEQEKEGAHPTDGKEEDILHDDVDTSLGECQA